MPILLFTNLDHLNRSLVQNYIPASIVNLPCQVFIERSGTVGVLTDDPILRDLREILSRHGIKIDDRKPSIEVKPKRS
jgi:hypothetical protein